MIGCLQTCVCKQPIIALYFEFETVLKFYNLQARSGFIIFIYSAEQGLALTMLDIFCSTFLPKFYLINTRDSSY